MDSGRWTMDDGQRLCRALFRADSNIADPTDLTDPTDPSEKPIDQITNSRAIPSLEATPLKILTTPKEIIMASMRLYRYRIVSR